MITKARKLLIEIIILQNVLQKTFTIIDDSQKIFIDVMKSFAEIYVIFIIKIIKAFFVFYR